MDAVVGIGGRILNDSPIGQLPAESSAVNHEVFSASLTVPSRPESVRLAVSFLLQTARMLDVPAASNSLFEVALAEALNNAVKHGTDPSDTVLCEFEHNRRGLRIRVLGRTAIPATVVMPGADSVPAEFLPEQWHAIPESGYGLSLIAAVFPFLRPVSLDGRHGIEMELVY
jgi:anti-sigma regulatory factor (Ser/Thr protein kinase)